MLVDMTKRSRKREVVTMDLLGGGGPGGCGSSSSPLAAAEQELDLDDLQLPPPRGWEKRLDLESGQMFLRRILDDDDGFPSTRWDPRHLPNLELRLDSPAAECQRQSVCTLDKVRLALDRIKPPPVISQVDAAAAASGKRRRTRRGESESLEVAGCPSRLSYVLIAEENPRCARCGSDVPPPN